METSTTIDISKDVSKIIQDNLRHEIEKDFDNVLEEFKQKKGQIVAGILVSVMKTTDMRIMQDRIVFEIKS